MGSGWVWHPITLSGVGQVSRHLRLQGKASCSESPWQEQKVAEPGSQQRA